MSTTLPSAPARASVPSSPPADDLEISPDLWAGVGVLPLL